MKLLMFKLSHVLMIFLGGGLLIAYDTLTQEYVAALKEMFV